MSSLLCLTGVFIAALPLLPEMNSVIRDSAPVPHGCFASGVFCEVLTHCPLSFSVNLSVVDVIYYT